MKKMNFTLLKSWYCQLAILMTFLASAVTLTAQTATSNPCTPPAIDATAFDGDYDGTFGSMQGIPFSIAGVPAGATLNPASFQVSLNLSHTWVGDLVIKLVAPDNSVITLMSRPGYAEAADDGTGCCGTSNIINGLLTFIDGAASAETLAAAGDVTSATVSPNPGAAGGPATFAAFLAGIADPNGTWYIEVGDAVAGDAPLILASAAGAPCAITFSYTTAPAGDCAIVANPNCGTTTTINFESGQCTAILNHSAVLEGDCGNVAPLTINGFTGAFAPTTTGGLGSVNTAGAPASIVLTSANGVASGNNDTYVQFTAPEAGTITVQWDYTTNDSDAFFDPFGYTTDGTTALATGTTVIGDFGVTTGTGEIILTVTAGQVITFIQNTFDGGFGAATTTLSNFSFVGNAVVATTLTQIAGPATGTAVGPGIYTVTYEAPGANNTPCELTFEVLPFDGVGTALICDDHVQISLDETCTATVTADLLLEGEAYGCFDDFTVALANAAAGPYNQDALLGAADVNKTYFVKVTDPATGNSCWGAIHIEDKIGPTITCEDQNIPCNADPATTSGATANITAAPATAILDNAVATVAIDASSIPAGSIIADVNLTVDISHTWIGDMIITLTNPAGASAILWDGFCGSTDDLGITFDDDGIVPVLCSELANGGNFSFDPYGNAGTLAALEGTAANGAWTLTIEDTFSGDEGVLNSYTLSVKYYAPVAYAPAVADNCGNTSVVLTSEDATNFTCANADAAGQIVRVYTATDLNNGMTASCTSIVTLDRPNLDNIVWPANYDDLDEPAFACATTPSLENNTNLTGEPQLFGADIVNGDLCAVTASYEDTKIDICAGSYKLLREWKVINWCTSEVLEHNQIIKVLDKTAPTFQGPSDVTISTTSNSCTGTYLIPQVAPTDDCGNSFTYLYAGSAGVQNASNKRLFTQLPIGVHTFTIKVKDSCGNESVDQHTVTVEDQIPPTPVCLEVTQVALTVDEPSLGGTALAFAPSFDNGSHDNCEIASIQVSRETPNFNCSNEVINDYFNNGYFAPSNAVKFYCCEAGENIMVTLTVTDISGNANTCMVQVLVEDKLAPTCIAPANVTVFCDDQVNGAPINLWNTEVFGQPSFFDNCGFDTTYVRTWNLDNCGKGSITRSWSVEDQGGLTDNCSQTITVGSHSDFVVNFPEDVTFNNCDLGNVPGATIFDDECELVAVNVEDVQYDVVPDACFKIIRTYTVINWCVYDANANNNPAGAVLNAAQHIWRDGVNFGNNFGYGNGSGTSDGYMQYSQVIKVNDTNKPTITSACEDVTFNDYSNGCDGFASLSITATDACTQAGDLEYRWFIYPNGNLTGAPLSGTGATVSGEYPYGTHIIKWEVEDGCGNKSFCDYTFTVRDAKAPTIVCLNGVAANLSLMDTNGDGTGDQGMVEIWDNEFFDSWGDNCTPNAQLKLAVCKSCNTMPNTKAVTFDCDDLGPQQVRLWVQDAAGNGAYCETFVDIQDNSGICTTAAATIAGTIANEDNETVANVAVSANAGSSLPTATATTGQNGAFLLNNLTGASYNVSAAKNNDPLNGVTTYDIVLISKHILGVQTLNSPYKMIAADVNKSNSISAYDMVELRKLILHVTEQFSNNTSWRFVPATFAFATPTNPWAADFPESMNVTPGSEADFTAVKVGDVNGNATTNNLLGAAVRNEVGTLTLTADNTKLVAGQEYTVNFKGTEAAGFQFTMNFDKNALEVVSVSNEENFGIFADAVTASFNNANTFAITFRANKNVELASALSINSRITTAEAYNNEGELMNVALQFNGAAANVAGANFELFQNTPNPFKGETTIGFNMPQAGAATLTIFDAAGRTIKTVNGDFAKGYNAVTVSELNATGVLYYQLDSNNDSATKMMIIAE